MHFIEKIIFLLYKINLFAEKMYLWLCLTIKSNIMNTIENNNRKAQNERIINTMVSQLGGNRFFVMTGSKPQYKDVNTNNPLIALKLVRNQSKANYLKISYMSAFDTYKMEFVKCSSKEMKTIEELDGIYGDQLQEVFTSKTGLYTRL